jgi:DNA-binding NarL/FixJ family response regulator
MPQAEPTTKRTTVLLVDDHPVVRHGLRQLIELQPDLVVSAEADSASRAIHEVEKAVPDVAIVDISMTGANGIELIKNLKARFPDLAILVLSMHDELLYAERALKAGARGYVMKREATERLIDAIAKVLANQIYISERVNERIIRRLTSESSESSTMDLVSRLSDRELEVLELLGHGHGTRQIADELHLSIKTIESHRSHIKEKLSLQTAPELVRFAVDWVSQQAGQAIEA